MPPLSLNPTAEQRKILDARGRVVKINARAGTGKTATLSREFHTTACTVQRDLAFIKQCGFPVAEAGPGVYRLDKDIIANLGGVEGASGWEEEINAVYVGMPRAKKNLGVGMGSVGMGSNLDT